MGACQSGGGELSGEGPASGRRVASKVAPLQSAARAAGGQAQAYTGRQADTPRLQVKSCLDTGEHESAPLTEYSACACAILSLGLITKGATGSLTNHRACASSACIC